MAVVETKVSREPWDVDRRLAELGLNREKLLLVRDVAISESANATPFHAANAAGTFAYHNGTWALRDQFVGDDWYVDRADGIEAIKSDATGIRIAYSNVDQAADDDHMPQPRTKKGAGAERAAGDLFAGFLPAYAPAPGPGPALYYLMVDEKGAAELTRPVVKNGRFTTAIERIFLSHGDDEDADAVIGDNSDAIDDFDPQVARK